MNNLHNIVTYSQQNNNSSHSIFVSSWHGKARHKKERIPIFSFADGEMGPISNALIRGIERFTGQPKIKKIYLDYVNDERPNHLFWQDAVDRLALREHAFDTGAYIPKQAACW